MITDGNIDALGGRMPRWIARAVVVAVLGFGAGPSAQTRSEVPRTPWGHPDLQGRWTNFTLTPLERPIDLGAKEYFTDREAAEYAKTAFQRYLESINFVEEAAISGEFEPGVWGEDRGLVPTRRTSLIIGPTGRIPSLTPPAQRRATERAAQRKQRPADGPEDRSLNERCLWFQVGGPPMLPGIVYNSNYQIVQTATHVMIVAELGNAIRVIPIDGRPRLPDAIRQWQGDSRGRWEGDTLVVETSNFNDKVQFRGATNQLRLVERFARVDRDTIMYTFTASDPTSWTDSWTAEIPMRSLNELMYEFACHEANYGLANILKGARAEESSSR
jgi:hypothetical protein